MGFRELYAPAADRNKGPIAEVLKQILPATGRMLEVASGTGQHVVHFAGELPGWEFYPSDLGAESVASIEAYTRRSKLANVHPPMMLDVSTSGWSAALEGGSGGATFDAVLCINMVHISPWETTLGLFSELPKVLATKAPSKRAHVILYGPYRVGGTHTSEGNARFDASLKAQDPRWGIRDMEAINALAEGQGLTAHPPTPMPANNYVLQFTR